MKDVILALSWGARKQRKCYACRHTSYTVVGFILDRSGRLGFNEALNGYYSTQDSSLAHFSSRPQEGKPGRSSRLPFCRKLFT